MRLFYIHNRDFMNTGLSPQKFVIKACIYQTKHMATFIREIEIPGMEVRKNPSRARDIKYLELKQEWNQCLSFQITAVTVHKKGRERNEPPGRKDGTERYGPGICLLRILPLILKTSNQNLKKPMS